AEMGAQPCRLFNAGLVGGKHGFVVEHAEFDENVAHAAHTDLDDVRLDLPHFAGFQHDGGNAGVAGAAPQRTFRAAAVDKERASKRLGDSARFNIAEVGAKVGVIRALNRGGVKIDAVVNFFDKFGEDDVREAAGHAAVWRPREGAVQV